MRKPVWFVLGLLVCLTTLTASLVPVVDAPSITVDTNKVSYLHRQKVIVSVSGGTPNGIVMIQFARAHPIGVVWVDQDNFDGDGEFEYQLEIPLDWSTGSYTVRVKDSETGQEGSMTFTVTTPPPSPPPRPNKRPKADAGPNVKISVGSTIHFSGAGSYDKDGYIISYSWDFGDGSTATGDVVSHVYSKLGQYTATLTVKDNRGAEDSDKCHVKVWDPPVHVMNRFGELVPGKKKGHVVDASDVANTTVTLNTTEPVTVTVLVYDGNPYPEDPIPAIALPIYVDVEVSNSTAVEWPIYVEMFYTDEEVEGLEESSLGIYYWFNGTWQRCSDTGVDIERNVVWAYMTAEEASGSPILMGGMPTIIIPPLPPILSNLTITPDEVERGDNVTIGFDIENIDSQSFTYIVTMRIENVESPPPSWPPYNVTLMIYVELEAYESKAVSHTITLDTVGDYDVTVDGLTGRARALRPAEFVVSDLSITPEEVELGEGIDVWTFKISVDVKNVGELEGSHTVDLMVDGSVVESRTVMLIGGERRLIVYDVMRGVGFYAVEVDGLTGSFEVKAPPKPAEFEVADLEIAPEEVEEGEEVTIAFTVSNVGEEEGVYTAELEIDGSLEDSEEVTLAGGESAEVSFEVMRDAGSYQVGVDGLAGSFTVIEPLRPGPVLSPGYVAGIAIIIVAAAAIIYIIKSGKVPQFLSSKETTQS